MTVTVEKVRREIEHPLSSGVVEFLETRPLKEHVEGGSFERPLGDVGLEL